MKLVLMTSVAESKQYDLDKDYNKNQRPSK